MQLREGALLARVGRRLHELDDQLLTRAGFFVAAPQPLLAALGAEQGEVLEPPRSLTRHGAIGVLLAESFQLHPPGVLAFARTLSRGVLALSFVELALGCRQRLRALGSVALLVVVSHQAPLFSSVSKQPRSLQVHHLTAANEPAIQQPAFRLRLQARAGGAGPAPGAQLQREGRIARSRSDSGDGEAGADGR